MNKLFLLMLPLLFVNLKHGSQPTSAENYYQDTTATINVFGDNNYRLNLNIFNKEFDYLSNNSTLTFAKIEKGSSKNIFTDSLMCMKAEFKMVDFNNDNVRDILVYGFSDVRSNESYYLYIVDKKNKKLTRIKGFEEIKNPEFDLEDNVITSFAVSGRDYYSFFRINSKNELIDLKKTFYAQHDDRDSVKYEKVLRQIKAIKN